eukprot:g46782.t1
MKQLSRRREPRKAEESSHHYCRDPNPAGPFCFQHRNYRFIGCFTNMVFHALQYLATRRSFIVVLLSQLPAPWALSPDPVFPHHCQNNSALSQYIAFHKKYKTQPPNSSLVAICNHDLANDSTKDIAIITQRVFLIDWSLNWDPLTDYLMPNLIDWTTNKNRSKSSEVMQLNWQFPHMDYYRQD